MSYEFRWIEWNRDKVAQHDVEPEEAEFVVNNARRPYPLKVDDEKSREKKRLRRRTR